MLFSFPLFTPTFWFDEPSSLDYGLSLIYKLNPQTVAGKIAFSDTVLVQSQIERTPLIRLYINPDTVRSQSKKDTSLILDWESEGVQLSSLRSNEKEIIQLEKLPENQIYLAIYDTSSDVKFNAALGIAQTFMVCIVLSAGAGMFSKLSTDLVIAPIENMIEKVNNIAKDPLAAANEEEERLLLEEIDETNQNDAN